MSRMKTNNKIYILALLLIAYVITTGFYFKGYAENNSLTGAWQLENNNHEEILLFADNYFSHTKYNKKEKKFEFTRGGNYQLKNDQLLTMIEFDTRQKDEIGKAVTYNFSIENNKLLLNINGKKETWKQLDKGTDNLAGTWRITARKQEEKVVPIHQAGPRKTVKILTGTRFQWAAINPETKEFFGTGGGTYTFMNGNIPGTLNSFQETAVVSELHFLLTES